MTCTLHPFTPSATCVDCRSPVPTVTVGAWLVDGACRLMGVDVFTDEQWKTRVDDLLATKTGKSARELEMECERDEWKRRAEAAEGRYAKELARNAVAAIVREPPSPNARPVMPHDELGRGIRALPAGRDNSIAHLDEDLLCEDA